METRVKEPIVSNGWVNELETEMNNGTLGSNTPTISNKTPEPKNDLEKVVLKTAELGERYRRLLAKDQNDPIIKNQIAECERLIVQLEQLRADLEKLGPGATINDVRKMKEEEKKQETDGGFGPIKKLINKNVPKAAVEPEVSHNNMPPKPRSFFKQNDPFFRSFIYTAIGCGILMSAYMFMLF